MIRGRLFIAGILLALAGSAQASIYGRPPVNVFANCHSPTLQAPNWRQHDPSRGQAPGYRIKTALSIGPGASVRVQSRDGMAAATAFGRDRQVAIGISVTRTR